MKKDVENRPVLKSYPVRLPEDILNEIELARSERSSKTGRKITSSSVFRDALALGIAMYRNDTKYHIALPSRVAPGEAMAIIAAELVQLGLAALDSGPVPDSSGSR